jgi:hypothetical protein
MFRSALLSLIGLAATVVVAQPPPPLPPGRGPGVISVGGEPQKPSHRPGPNEAELEDFRLWLEVGKKKSRPPEVDPKLLKELMDKLPKEQKADPKQIEKMMQENQQFKNPEFLKQLEKLLESGEFPKNLENKFPKDVPPPKIENGEDLKDKFQQVIEEGKKHAGPEVGPKDVTPPKMDGLDGKLPKEAVDPSAAKSPAAENEWVKWLQKNFGDSPAAEGAAKDLIEALNKKDGKGLFDDIPELKNGGWKDLDQWGKSNAGDLWKLKPPDAPSTGMTAPNVGGGGGGGSSLGGGGGGGGGGSSFGGGGAGLGGGATALAIIAAVAAGIFLAVLLLRKWKLDRDRKAAGSMSGPVPIDFDAIRSRDELVRVFNRVSLDRCGVDARSWNHRVVADHVGQTEPAHATPANEVAGLYERARYAPADEDLTAGEFADARRDLRAIAGVSP